MIHHTPQIEPQLPLPDAVEEFVGRQVATCPLAPLFAPGRIGPHGVDTKVFPWVARQCLDKPLVAKHVKFGQAMIRHGDGAIERGNLFVGPILEKSCAGHNGGLPRQTRNAGRNGDVMNV
jgi:hypothetical protein